jgi:hypothetical protein
MAEIDQLAQPPQPTGPEGMPGGAPPEGAPESPAPETTGEQPPLEPSPEEVEQQIGDVDQILASLKSSEPESELDEMSDEELEEAKMGRPRKGMSFGQDSHPRGRDPLGHKENMDVLRGRIQRRKPTRKSAFSLENAEISNLIKQLKTQKEAPTQPSILSEDNILDDEKLID